MSSRPPERFTNALHVFALCSLALAQPLFDLLGRNGEFFVASKAGPFDVLLLVGIVWLGVPALLVALELLASLIGHRTGRAVHLALIGALVGLLVLPPLGRWWRDHDVATFVIAGSTGALTVGMYVRWRSARLLITYLSIAAVVVPANFLLNTDAKLIVLPAPGKHVAEIEVAKDIPIVLLIFDELPLSSLLDEHLQIDAARFPNFARFAAGATWYRNTTSVADGTTYAIPAIMAGRYPEKNTLPTNVGYPNNLFTLLGGSFKIVAHEPVTGLCPKQLCRPDSAEATPGILTLVKDSAVVLSHALLPERSAQRLLPRIDLQWNAFWSKPQVQADPPKFHEDAERRQAAAVRSLEGRDKARFVRIVAPPIDEHTFSFIHLLMPHALWRFLPSGNEYGSETTPGLMPHEQWAEDIGPVLQSYRRHLLQVGFADRLLGILLEHLKQTGIFEQTMIIVMADHGASFRPGGSRRYLTESNWSDILRVPLLLKWPGQTDGMTVDSPVETVDVFPTITEALGIRVNSRIDGRSLIHHDAKRTRIAFSHNFVRLTLPNDLSGLRETVLRKVKWFGSGSDKRRFFGGEHYWWLIDKPVSQLRLSGETPMAGTLAQPHLFGDVEPDSGFIPALISGRISGLTSADHVVVAVNGFVRAVVPFSDTEDAFFSAIVDEASFRPGFNEIQLFIREDGEEEIFRIVRLSFDRYSLRKREGVETIESGSGERFLVREGMAKGWVERFRSRHATAHVSGWAAAHDHRIVPTVVLFADDRFVGSTKPALARPDVVRVFADAQMLHSGFTLDTPVAAIKGAKVFRVFALSPDGYATELRYGPQLIWPSSIQ